MDECHGGDVSSRYLRVSTDLIHMQVAKDGTITYFSVPDLATNVHMAIVIGKARPVNLGELWRMICGKRLEHVLAFLMFPLPRIDRRVVRDNFRSV